MADYITKILTAAGEKQIDYTALANLPDIYTKSDIDKAEIIELVSQNIYTKEETLADTTKTVYGLDSNAVPNDVFDKLATASVPVGTICWYAKDDIPSGYLKCDGSAISRSNYSALFAVIGTVFGTGDESTTFRIPDLRAKFIRGPGTVGRYTASFGKIQEATTIRTVETTGAYSMFEGSGFYDMDYKFEVREETYRPGTNPGTSTVYYTTVRPYNIALTPIIKY